MRIIVKSHTNGSNEQIYFCTEKTMFETPAEEFFFMEENDTIDIDTFVNVGQLESLPLPFDRALKAV